MLLSTCSREALLARPPFPPWNLPSFTVESTLPTPCSRSDTPSFAKVQLSPTLTLFPVMIWCFGQTVLFLFLLARAAPTFKAHYARVFLLQPAPFCKLFAGLGNTIKSATSFLFYHLTLILSSPPSFLLSQTLWQIWQELSSLFFCSIRLQWVPGHSFSLGNNSADELARRGALLAPSTILCSLSSLTSPIHSRLISDWRRTVSYTVSYLTHRFSRFSPRNLCSLVMLAVSSLVFAAMDTAFF